MSRLEHLKDGSRIPVIASGSVEPPPNVETTQAENKRTATHICAVCQQTFAARKSLLRHVRSVHDNATSHTCLSCGRVFARKDILDRHRNTQHNKNHAAKQCKTCLEWIRPRASASHRASDACRRSQEQADVTTMKAFLNSVVASRPSNNFPLPAGLPAENSLLLASISLFAKLKPWGRGSESLWLVNAGISSPSYELLSQRAVITALLHDVLKNYNHCRDRYTLETVLILNITDCWMSGWESTTPHRFATMALEKRMTATYSRERAFAGPHLADAFSTVLHKELSGEDLPKCWTLYKEGIELVRDACVVLLNEARRVADVETRMMSQMSRDLWVLLYINDLRRLAALALTIGGEDANAARPG